MTSRLYTSLKLLPALLLSAVMLSGCATTPNSAYQPAENQPTGYLVGSIGGRSVRPHINVWQRSSLVYRSLEADSELAFIDFKREGLLPTSDIELDEANLDLFAHPLAPGQYEIVAVQFVTRNGFEYNSADKGAFSIPFTIEQGRVTYLGEAVGWSEWGSAGFGIPTQTSGYFVRKNSWQRDQQEIAKKYPFLARLPVSLVSTDLTAAPYIVAQRASATSLPNSARATVIEMPVAAQPAARPQAGNRAPATVTEVNPNAVVKKPKKKTEKRRKHSSSTSSSGYRSKPR